MAKVLEAIAGLTLAFAYPAIVVAGTIWLAVATRDRRRSDRQFSATPWVGWMSLTALIILAWFFFILWFGMGIGHAPEGQAAPFWLVVIIVGAITGYAFAIRALVRLVDRS